MLSLTVVGNASGSVAPNAASARIVCERLRCAQNGLTRMIGLLGEKELDATAGLWIKPSNGVHTFGMRFSIDVIALDKGNKVVKVWQDVGPQRMIFAPKQTRSVLELAAGTAAVHRIAAGDTCRFDG